MPRHLTLASIAALWTHACSTAGPSQSPRPRVAGRRSPPKKLAAGTWLTGSPSGKVCTPAPAPRHRSPADQVTTVCASWWQTCGARVAVVLLWGVATANQRRRPLLGCGGTAGGAGLVTQPPRGASGAARVRGRFLDSRGRVFRPREIDRAALPAQSRRLPATCPSPLVLGRSAWCSPRA